MATAAAAIIAKARRDIQHHFFSNDAVRPERAVGFEPSRRIEQSQLERMRARGIIHETESGKYWLDVAAYDIDLRRRHAAIRTVLLVLVILLTGGVLFGVKLL